MRDSPFESAPINFGNTMTRHKKDKYFAIVLSKVLVIIFGCVGDFFGFLVKCFVFVGEIIGLYWISQ